MTDEQNLIAQLKNKQTQEKAFRILMGQYKERLYWHIRKIVILHADTDDVLQNTFVKVFKNIDKFKGDSKLYSWMYRIATNESITLINKRAKYNNVDITEYQHNLAETLQDDNNFSGEEIIFTIRQLSGKVIYKDVFVSEIEQVRTIMIDQPRSGIYIAELKTRNRNIIIKLLII